MTSLKQKYMPVLAGYEMVLSIKEDDIALNQSNLDIALHDYNACKSCMGMEFCRTFYQRKIDNRPTYYDLSRKGMKLYHKLHFALVQCPGPDERKLQISKRLSSERDDAPQGFYEYAGSVRDPFRESE